MTNTRSGIPWIVSLLAAFLLAGCGAATTDDASASEEVGAVQDALHRHNKWRSYKQRHWSHHHHPGSRHGHKPPKQKHKRFCEEREIECGTPKVCGKQIDCGSCADGESCELGKCVVDCVPDGTTSVACTEDATAVVVLDSCNGEVSVSACALGCLDGACIEAFCGDGTLQSDEECDDGNDVNTDACTSACVEAFCGDGFVHSGAEECDDGNAVDNDGCTNDCVADTCGNGTVDPGEACDDGNDVNTDACTASCQSAACGDGFVQLDEQCDDGNTSDTDACTSDCAVALCGDGILQDGVEACDDGNAVDNDGCTNECSTPVCGDGIVQSGEACDDGNPDDSDSCRSDCVEAFCGDGIVQDGEACDGGGFGFGNCRLDCTIPTCGDGIWDLANEDCDDGNTDNTDGCIEGCVFPMCGDGYVRAGVEDCDDGNADNADDCTNQCRAPRCGDGIVQSGEDCDDGNMNPVDGCSNNCRTPVCGDGVIQEGEACDDGNNTSNDGCSAACVKEVVFVFVTSALYSANLGGLDGGDAICQAHADAAGLPGQFRAWLAAGSLGSPSTRFTQWFGQYVLVDGVTVIADSWFDLTDFSLDAAINLDEYGNPAPLTAAEQCGPTGIKTTNVWSGARADGFPQVVGFCGDWTSTSGSAHTGDYSVTTGAWSQWCFPPCTYEAPIYCFGQEGVEIGL